MSISADFFAPPSTLLIQVTDPNTKQPKYAFPLQTSAWVQMQDTIRIALSFPLTKEDFKNKYGTFDDEATVETALTILGAIQKTAQDYGDPTTLISELPTFQTADEPPASIYGHAVWLAAQTQLTAQQIALLLNTTVAFYNEIGARCDVSNGTVWPPPDGSAATATN